MRFTGERFIPDQEKDSEITIEHLQRYEAVTKLAKGKIVLDAASGEGYGSALLANEAIKVYGLDISKEAVESARLKYQKANLQYIEGSVTNIPLSDKSVDMVISFETIEHINEAAQYVFMKEIKRVLKDDGTLVISTPNKKIYSDEFSYKNEFHIKEFYKEEFINMIEQEFKYHELYSQFKEEGYYLTRDSESILEKKGTYNEDFAKYYICIASNKRIESSNISCVSIQDETDYIKKLHRIIELQEEVDVRNNHLKELDTQIITKDQRITQLQDEVENKNNHLKELDESIITKDQRIMQLQDEVEDRNTYLKELDEKIITREQRIIQLQDKIEDKNIGISKLNNEISRYQGEISNLNEVNRKIQEQIERKDQEIEEKNKEIEREAKVIKEKSKQYVDMSDELALVKSELEQKANTLENIYHSTGWKILLRMYRIRDVVFPKDSKRRLFAKMAKRVVGHPKFYMKNLNKQNLEKFFKSMKNENPECTFKKLEQFEVNKQQPIQVQELKIIESEVYDDEIVFKYEEQPMVSIIIPVYNQYEYTYNCLKSIKQNTEDVTYEIIIADDVSTDETINLSKHIKNIKIIRNRENLGFLLNCNNAARQARGKYIHFLNNDTQVQQGWLASLVELVESDEKIGMVGSKLIYPTGELQEAGGIIWNDASGWNYGRLDDPNKPDYNYVREVDYISGASIMISKELWKVIGGFDERYVPAYYEDTDLAFEVRAHGYKVMYQPKSAVIHFEGISNGTDLNSGIKKYQVDNREKFIEKWQKALKEQYPSGECELKARGRGKNKKQILVIDHYVPHFDKDAGSKCTFNYISLFHKMGLDVAFIGDNFFPHEPYTEILQQMGINVLYGNWYHDNYEKWLEQNGQNFDYIYLNRPHISIKYIDLLKKCTTAKIIYFGHDLHYLRELRNYEFEKDKELLVSSEKWKKVEFELFNKADTVYVVGNYEQKVLQEQLPSKTIRNIPVYIYDKSKEPTQFDYNDRKNLLFVGGFNHKPNVDGVIWFCNEILPTIKREIPDIKLYIVGSNPPEEVSSLKNDHIIVTGFVSDEELSKLYQRSRVVVAPLRFGAGVKGKVVEAIYNQVPMITTSIGAEGLAEIDKYVAISDDVEEFARKTIELYKSEEEWHVKSQGSIEYIDKYFSQATAIKIVRQDIQI
ncbi:MAG: glycosyltransferase [Cellulosilyticum sp.]|nr:glycosyltransferase [Cellulosilyticum sp.]